MFSTRPGPAAFEAADPEAADPEAADPEAADPEAADPEATAIEGSEPGGGVLDATRARSAQRYLALVHAARDLANERHNAAFTVQDVIRRAESSLKGFYRCFTGKDELLLALLAEDSRIGAAILAERVAAAPDHRGRLHAAVTVLLDVAALPGASGYARVLVREQRRLSELHPDALRVALSPIAAEMARVIADATATGCACSADPERDAETVFALVLDGIDDATLGRADPRERAEYLWGFVRGALRVADPDPDAGGADATPTPDRSESEEAR